jgi:hypothetical protein
MAGIRGIEKGISRLRKNIGAVKKKSKGYQRPDDNRFDGDEADGWKPNTLIVDLINRKMNHGTSH